MKNPINIVIGDKASRLFVQFIEDKGVLTDKCVGILVSTDGKKKIVGSCGFDAHNAGFYFQAVSMGIECPGMLRKNGQITGVVAIKKSGDGAFYLIVNIDEKTVAARLYARDVDDLKALFASVSDCGGKA